MRKHEAKVYFRGMKNQGTKAKSGKNRYKNKKTGLVSLGKAKKPGEFSSTNVGLRGIFESPSVRDEQSKSFWAIKEQFYLARNSLANWTHINYAILSRQPTFFPKLSVLLSASF
jgi:hypothetical protein